MRGLHARSRATNQPVRLAALGTLLGGLLAALGWGLADGTDGWVSAALGTALVIAFFASGFVPLVVARTGGLRAGAGLAVLLLTYTLRLALVLLALRLATRADFVHPTALGTTVVITALAWSGVHLAVVLRTGRTR